MVILGVYDNHLLHSLMGSPLSRAGYGRNILDRLLDERSSVIGECLHQLLHLLQTWRVGGVNREPWLVLEVLGAPATDYDFMRFARSQILRIASSVFRRFEANYSTWPFSLFPLSLGTASDDQKRSMARELLAASSYMLDTYSEGVRRRFPSEAALLSKACQATLRADFSMHAFTTDLIERLHTELTHNIPARAPGLNFTNLSREAVLRQSVVLHVQTGGRHPMVAKSKGCMSRLEQVSIPVALLDVAESAADPTGPSAASSGAASSSDQSQAPALAPAGNSDIGLAVVPCEVEGGARVHRRAGGHGQLGASSGAAAREATQGPQPVPAREEQAHAERSGAQGGAAL